MNPMPADSALEKLRKLYWDTDIDPEQLFRLLSGEIKKIGHIDQDNLFRRLLMTYDWYTLLALIPRERLQDALSDSVIKKIFPKSLKEKYIYARRVLSN